MARPTSSEQAVVSPDSARRGGIRSDADWQRACFLRWQSDGDVAARDRLVECFTPLARNLARRYKHTSEPFEDLCQVAQLGLVNAVDRFDPNRGIAFATYAIPTILGELRRYFRNCSWAAHVPRRAQERALEMREVERALTDEYGRSPTVPELADYMKMSIEETLDGLQALRAYTSVSFDAPRSSSAAEDEASSYAETIGTEDQHYELVELSASLTDGLQALGPHNREILRMRFIEEMTQSQIAERIGVSQMQISRRLASCLGELREQVGVAPAA
ncbi:MAG: SigB/SigF/SigG family RNA polymerase sigma factor [Solirubrobacteraceae bacterium]